MPHTYTRLTPELRERRYNQRRTAMLDRLNALHEVTHPDHGRFQMEITYGIMAALYVARKDPSVDFAKQLERTLPGLLGALGNLKKWSRLILEAEDTAMLDRTG